MHWKVLLTVFVVIALVGLLFATERGRGYADYLKVRIGSFISTFLEITPKPKGNFQIRLSAQKSSFYGQNYQLYNSTLIVSGICQRSVRIGDSILHKTGKECEMRLDNFNGNIEYTIGGSIFAKGEASIIIINGNQFSPYSSRLQIEAEVIPLDKLLITGLAQDIKFSSITGIIERFKDGAVKSTESLKDESLEINGFIGYLDFDGTLVTLNGLANSVKNNFSW